MEITQFFSNGNLPDPAIKNAIILWKSLRIYLYLVIGVVVYPGKHFPRKPKMLYVERSVVKMS